MKSVNSTTLPLINNINRKLIYQFTLDGKNLPLSDIMDNLTLTWDIGLEQYSVGNVYIRELQFSVKSTVFVNYKSKINISVKIEGDSHTYNLGKFYVDTVTEQGVTKQIKAYDDMFLLNVGYFPSAKHTTTKAIINDICSQKGLTLVGWNNKTANINNEQLEGKTILEMLKLVSCVHGGTFFFDGDGALKFVKTNDTGITYTQSDYATPTLDTSISYKITKLKVIYGEEKKDEDGNVTDTGYYEVGEGADTQTLAISNVLLKGQKTQAKSILDAIKKMNGYKRFDTTVLLGDFRLEPMDLVTYVKDDISYKVPIIYLKATLSHGGLLVETKSPTLAESKNEFSFKGTLTQKIENVYTDMMQVKEIVANSITVDNLNAINAKIEHLEATDATITNLLAGNITSGNIQAGSITSDRLVIDDGFIKDSMIDTINANKILAGRLDTGAITIGSEDGKMIIADETIQISDGTHVRVQIGETGNGDYALVIYDAQGNVMFDATGITENAIKDAIIKDDMVADNANINAQKININSLFTAINEDGSHTLNGSKIFLDTQNQTLNVAFNNMTTKQNDLEEQTNVLSTQLNVQSGKIETLIQNTTVTEEGQTITLKDKVSSMEQDLDGITLQVGTIKSTVQEVVKEEIGNVSLNVYTILLSNEAQTIAVNNDRFPLTNETFTTTVQVYEGAHVRTDYKIGDIPDANGIKVSKPSKSKINFKVSTDTPLTSNNGNFIIPITIDNKTFNKTFSWSCAKQGLQGTDAKLVTITGEQFFKYSNNYTGTPTPNQIVLTANLYNSTETGKWQYNNNGVWVDWKDSNGNVITDRNITIKHTSPTLQATNSVFLRYYVDSDVFDTYTVARISDGANGNDAQYVTVTGEQVFKYSNNFSGTPTPETIILKATITNTTEKGKWQYMDENSVWQDYTKSGNLVTSKTIDVLHNSKIFGTTDAKSMRLRYYINDSLYDEITLVKVSDGAKGTDGKNGIDGTNGKDAYTIILTNEAQTIPTTSSRVPLSASTYSTDIVVYQGTTKRTDFTLGTIKSANGITVAKPSNSKVNFTVSTGTALSADNGTFTIPITIDGKTFNKTFSWSCSKQGNKGDKGDKGDNGVDAKAVYVTGEQVFKYSNNFKGTPTPETIPLTVARVNTTETGKWQYMDENSAWQDYTQGGTLQTGDTINVSYNSKIFGKTSAKSMRVRYYISNTVYDEVTLVKVSDGAKGSSGITVVLTNENHSFLAGNRGNISTKTSATTKVYAYKGATPVAFTLGTITAPDGMTISDNLATGGRTITFTVATGTSLANSGTIDIPVIVDGVTYTKTFSWSKSLKGAQGNAGADAKALNIHATSQIFRSLDGDTYEPSTITLTAKCENITFSKWQYSLDGSNFVDVVDDKHEMNVSGTDLTVSHSSDLFSNNMSSIVFKALATNETYYDTMTIAKVKDLSEDLKELEGEVITNRDAIATLELNTDSINASVQRVEQTFISTVDGINTNINTLTNRVNATMTSEDVKIEIQKEMANGTNKVSTSTGFTFDDNGLRVSKSDSEMSTQITEDGMTITKNDETVLTANNKGVQAKNLYATTYLIVGNSRFESYKGNRTGCFYVFEPSIEMTDEANLLNEEGEE